MQWIEIQYCLSAEEADLAGEALVAAGFTDFAAASRDDDRVDVTCYAASTAPVTALAVLAALGMRPTAQTTLDEAVLYAHLHPQAPIRLAPGVMIQPGSEAPPPGDLVLHLPVGPAWGDGRHPTTQLCARRLMTWSLSGLRVLDLGCGSGLLGVLASRRGAAQVDFTDNDEHALRVARACCEANGVPPRCRLGSLLDALPADAVYDAIVANLWADLVLEVCADPRLASCLPRGRFLGSGVHVRRKDDVNQALQRCGFTLSWTAEEAWWWAFEAER